MLVELIVKEMRISLMQFFASLPRFLDVIYEDDYIRLLTAYNTLQYQK